ncbi:nuclear transport factor 2 family protein [Sphingobium sp. DEHP117]|uniref:nuclear transport factor 2 family protein n=1 Tax=Sphingobium sp. DEHP117 TaxID=2993436 RepID=UPI0027D4F84C|nr:nuclear transport factor 2 family protein [Sphingobium sp. DEHP117]MDQ4420391.1 nuclear transport factor 2 family protein [Sphingobium sp. DEHP117]
MDALTRLVAIEEIRQLKSRYFRTMDTHDLEGMAEVFCKDAVLDVRNVFRYVPLGGDPVGPTGPVIHGRDNIMDWLGQSLPVTSSAHHGHGHEITIVSETEAHGVIAMEDVVRRPDCKSPVLHGYGHYYERYAFEDGAWRIAESRLERLLIDLHTDEFN